MDHMSHPPADRGTTSQCTPFQMGGNGAGFVPCGSRSHPHSSCLLYCSSVLAWRVWDQAPGSSLSLRLPTLVVWLSFGLRGPGVAPELGEAQEGSVPLEAALPSRLD